MPRTACLATKRTRLKQAHILSHEPGASLGDLAKTWGISKGSASEYLNRHCADLSGHFNSLKSVGVSFTNEEALFRLRFVQTQVLRGASLKKISTLLGISRQALSLWLQRWAPDGVSEAIEDLEV